MIDAYIVFTKTYDYEEQPNVCGVYTSKEDMLVDFPKLRFPNSEYPYEYTAFKLNKKYEDIL